MHHPSLSRFTWAQPAVDPVDVPQSPGVDLGVYETYAFSNDVSDYRNP
jgi:hypothetical protein